MMKTMSRGNISKTSMAVFGVILALPALAGIAQNGTDPSAVAADWQATVDNLMVAPASGPAQTPTERRYALVSRAAADGTVPVIVRFKEDPTELGLSEAQVQSGRAAKRQNALDRLGLAAGRDRTGSTIKEFHQMGGLALRADAGDVVDLLNNPEVLDVVEDVAYPPALLQSVPLLGASGGTFAGYTGAGQIVAILDTGVDQTHPFLAGKVISEACYSSSYPASGISSLCPDGNTSSTVAGAGLNCDAVQWGAACNHGPHVAGIVAGDNGAYAGVAKDAHLIAIQVFTGFPSIYCGTSGARCVMAYTSDIIRGLEQVYALRSTYAIAAANLSLGGGGYTSNCDTDATKPAIDNLRSAGIATVIASGNNGYTNAISAPACISSAISVGATCDAAGSYCAAADAVASYSNSAPFLSLLAPGSLITSSVPGGGYAGWHGTSMAAPHVAGAWAVAKQAKPAAGVEEVLASFQASGQRVTDPRNGVGIARIAPAAAIDVLTFVPPPLPTTAAAATEISTSGFTANWTSVPDATGYRLDVSTSSTFVSFISGYQDLDVGATTGSPISALSPGTTYYYRLRAYNTGGSSSDSNVAAVTTTAVVPRTPALTSATDITENSLRVNWNAVAGATGYRLDVSTHANFNKMVSGYDDLDVGNVNSQAITGLKSHTQYYARLRAYSTAGTSASSTTLEVRTQK